MSAVTMLGTTAAVPLPVNLAALILPANSTSEVFASSTYYGHDYGQGDVVPFYEGPNGIQGAIDQNAGNGPIVILSSGWGAGQTGTAIGNMAASHDPAMSDLQLVVLDNDTNAPNGGFWTRYPWFAPLLLTSAAPTPDNTDAPIVVTQYEYNINSDAPAYPINVVADANSLMAYVYDYGGQATAPMPAEALNPVPPNAQHYSYVVEPDGKTYTKVPVDGNVTYVMFTSGELPLLRPLGAIPGGNVAADALRPAVTTLVNYGYPDNNPIPQDPGANTPAGVVPPSSQTSAAFQQLPGDVEQGLQAAQHDIATGNIALFSPSSIPPAVNSIPTQVTNPLLGAANPLAGTPNSPLSAGTSTVPSVVNAAPQLKSSQMSDAATGTSDLLSRVSMTDGHKVTPGGSGSPSGANPGTGGVQNANAASGSFVSGLSKSRSTGGSTRPTGSRGR